VLSHAAKLCYADAVTAVLDQEQTRWLQGEASSVTVASSDTAGVPSLGQGIGTRIDATGTRIRVFIVEARSRALIHDLRAGRPIAVVFTHSPTLRSLQVKAPHATEVPLEPGDREHIAAYVDAVAKAWVTAPEPFVRTLLATEPGPMVAFELQPTSAFDQTPGPKAGAALPGSGS
jgi:hypothetical protein